MTFRVVHEVEDLNRTEEEQEASDGIVGNADFKMATVYCPFCGVSTDFHDEVVGTVQPCPNCGSKILIEGESGSWPLAILIGFLVFLACVFLLWKCLLMLYLNSPG